MTITNRIGRPLLAGIFVSGGLDQLRDPGPKADAAQTVLDDAPEGVPVPDDAIDAVKINGAVQVVAGALLAANKLPRLASLALAASLVPTTLAGHRFWELDGEDRAMQRIHFLKNAAMFGGLLIASGDTGRRPSLAWQANEAVQGGAGRVASRTADAVETVSGAVR